MVTNMKTLQAMPVKQDRVQVCDIAQQLYGSSWQQVQLARGFTRYLFELCGEEEVVEQKVVCYVHISTPDLVMLAYMYSDGRYDAVVGTLRRLGVYYEQDSFES